MGDLTARLTQNGNNLNEDKPFESSETGFASIELFCRTCGQVVASDLRTRTAMIFQDFAAHNRMYSEPGLSIGHRIVQSEAPRTRASGDFLISRRLDAGSE